MSVADVMKAPMRLRLGSSFLALAFIAGAGGVTHAQAQKKFGQPGVSAKQQAQQNLKAATRPGRPMPAPGKAPVAEKTR
jgi:uncharacterized protein HemX